MTEGAPAPVLRGGCYCGAVRYEAAARPFHETVCHCADCRRVIGATAVAWFTVPQAAFRVTAGRPVEFRSSARVVRSFCGACGTSLTFRRDDLPDEIDVTTASLDEPSQVAPKDHTHVAARPSWSVLCDGLPAFPNAREEP